MAKRSRMLDSWEGGNHGNAGRRAQSEDIMSWGVLLKWGNPINLKFWVSQKSGGYNTQCIYHWFKKTKTKTKTTGENDVSMLIALKDKWWDSTLTFWRSLLVFEDEKEMNCGCGIFCFCFLFCCCHLLSVRLAQDKDLDGLENHKEFFRFLLERMGHSERTCFL